MTRWRNDECEGRLEFKIATICQAARATSLVNSAFCSEPTGQTRLFDSQERRVKISPLERTQGIQGIIDFSDSFFLIDTLPNGVDIVASSFLRRPADHPAWQMSNGTAYFGLIAVRPEHHRSKYGMAVLQEAERLVSTRWGAKRLEMVYMNTYVNGINVAIIVPLASKENLRMPVRVEKF